MEKAVIFDLDGTIANIDHRLKYISGSEKNYDLFNAACGLDHPYMDIKSLLQIIFDSGEYKILIVTGRDGSEAERTVAWLTYHKIPFDSLYMRKPKDKRSDVDVKMDIYMDEIIRKYNVEMVFEDRDRVVNMWRELGLRCLQVKEGDY